MSRRRATVIFKREKKILLVRDKGKTSFSLPGGKANENEPSMAAAIREIYEELTLTSHWAKRLPECDHQAKFNSHEVCLLISDDEIALNRRELEEYIWWDGVESIPRFPHVDIILAKYEKIQTIQEV